MPPQLTICSTFRPYSSKPVDDGQRAERGRLDERAVDLRRRGVERLPEQQARQPLVHQHRAVAVVPVQRQQARLARRQLRRRRAERLVRAGLLAERLDVVHEPVEDVAHRRLARLQPVIARQNAARHNAAQAGDVRQLLPERHDHHVARARADDLHQRARRDAGPNGAQMRVERPDRHRQTPPASRCARPTPLSARPPTGRCCAPLTAGATAVRPASDQAATRNSASG